MKRGHSAFTTGQIPETRAAFHGMDGLRSGDRASEWRECPALNSHGDENFDRRASSFRWKKGSSTRPESVERDLQDLQGGEGVDYAGRDVTQAACCNPCKDRRCAGSTSAEVTHRGLSVFPRHFRTTRWAISFASSSRDRLVGSTRIFIRSTRQVILYHAVLCHHD
jgi:hypothetical protein